MSSREDKVQALSNSDLERFVDRLVNLETEKKEVSDSIKEVLEEAESAGFSKKAMRLAVKRKMETADQKAAREQVESDLDLMLSALGMLSDTPLGQAAVHRATAH